MRRMFHTRLTDVAGGVYEIPSSDDVSNARPEISKRDFQTFNRKKKKSPSDFCLEWYRIVLQYASNEDEGYKNCSIHIHTAIFVRIQQCAQNFSMLYS